MTSSLDTSGSYGYDSPTGRYEYSIVTPWRAIASAAITMKQYGFISFDYEFVDYSAAGFNFNRIGSVDDITLETALNNTINEKYTGAHNIRVGAELAYEVFPFQRWLCHYGEHLRKRICRRQRRFCPKYLYPWCWYPR